MITKIHNRNFIKYDKEKGNRIKIAILNDPSLLHDGVGVLLESAKSLEIVAEAKDMNELTSFYMDFFPDAVDILLIDFGFIPKESIDFIETFVKRFPTVKVVVLTYHDDETYVIQSFRAGVSGYMLKGMDVPSIIEVVQLIAVGGSYIDPKVTHYMINKYLQLIDRKYKGTFIQEKIRIPLHLLTKRECEVLQLLAEEKSNVEMGDLLCISDKTLRNHMSSIYRKMEVESRTAAVVKAVKNGWIKIT